MPYLSHSYQNIWDHRLGKTKKAITFLSTINILLTSYFSTYPKAFGCHHQMHFENVPYFFLEICFCVFYFRVTHLHKECEIDIKTFKISLEI